MQSQHLLHITIVRSVQVTTPTQYTMIYPATIVTFLFAGRIRKQNKKTIKPSLSLAIIHASEHSVSLAYILQLLMLVHTCIVIRYLTPVRSPISFRVTFYTHFCT